MKTRAIDDHDLEMLNYQKRSIEERKKVLMDDEDDDVYHNYKERIDKNVEVKEDRQDNEVENPVNSAVTFNKGNSESFSIF